MPLFNDNNTWFDAELQCAVDEQKIDFTSVETVLLRRIRESDSLGYLAVLQLDEFPAFEILEEVEQNLYVTITQYHEYDEPVNECLKADVDLTERQWDRLKNNLYEKLRPVVRLPLWEQQVMAPCSEPTFGHWEAMESVLFDRIIRSDVQLKETWITYETKEEPVTVATLEAAERRLDEQINEASGKPFWEQVVGSEEIVPYVRWERAESSLFSRIVKQGELSLSNQPFWQVTHHYRSLVRAAGSVAAAVVIAVISVVTVQRTVFRDESVPTLVYQLEGPAVESSGISNQVSGGCSMVAGGAATLVNTHGSIEMHNDARISIEKITGNEARYRVDFAASRSGANNGNVSFLVHPQKRRKSFLVQTADYRIEVTGTYFRVDADMGGKASTRVLEGSVRITGSPLGDTVLHAGQYLQYDPTVHAYRIFSDGRIVNRETLEKLPGIDELLGYKAVLLRTLIPGAEVHIDGKFCGITPLMLRQSATWHDLRLVRRGWATVDTSLFLGGPGLSYDFAFALDTVPRLQMDAVRVGERAGGRKLHESTETRKRKSETVVPDKIAGMMLRSGKASSNTQLYGAARDAERTSNWRKAVALYKQVLEDPTVTPLRREDALFSIAKLHAEHEGNNEVAKEEFLTYLALFPTGSFAGESWLRLAELEFGSNPDNAIGYYLKYFEMFPRHPRIAELQHRVGVIYLQQKQYSKAVDMFERALSNLKSADGNEQRSIAENLHRALMAQGREERAESVRIRYLVSEGK